MLNEVEIRYSPIKKLCVSVYHSYAKLKYHLMPFYVVSQTDIIKYMMWKPLIHGQIGKWMIALTQFSLQYCHDPNPGHDWRIGTSPYASLPQWNFIKISTEFPL